MVFLLELSNFRAPWLLSHALPSTVCEGNDVILANYTLAISASHVADSKWFVFTLFCFFLSESSKEIFFNKVSTVLGWNTAHKFLKEGYRALVFSGTLMSATASCMESCVYCYLDNPLVVWVHRLCNFKSRIDPWTVQ